MAPYSIPFSVQKFCASSGRPCASSACCGSWDWPLDTWIDKGIDWLIRIDSDWCGLIRIGIYRCTSLLSHSTRYLLSRVSLNVCIHRSRSRRLSEGLSGCCAVRSKSFGRLAYHICSHSKTKKHTVGRFFFGGSSWQFRSQLRNDEKCDGSMAISSVFFLYVQGDLVFHLINFRTIRFPSFPRNLRMMQDLWMLVRGLLKSGRRLDSAGFDSRDLWLALAVKFGSKDSMGIS